MKIKFYVIRCDAQVFTCFVTSRDEGISAYSLGYPTSKVLPPNSRTFRVNPFCFHLFLNELNNCPTYHQAVAQNIKGSDAPFVIQLVPATKEFMDKTW